MLTDKITILNKTTLDCLNETDEVKIVKSFTQVGIKIFEADFGFVWSKSSKTDDLKLIYKSPSIPFKPNPPRKDGRNWRAIKKGVPDFVSETKKALDTHYVNKYIKSFVIIPLKYKNSIYGSMVLCFKQYESFPKEKRVLSYFIGNSVSQTITISRFIESERESLKKERLAKNTARVLREEKLKMEFITNASHELRTPLAIIRGNADLAMKMGAKKTLKSPESALRAINHEVEHLSNILSDLTLITIDKITYDKVDLRSLILNTIDRCKVLANKKDVSVKAKSIPSVNILGSKIYLEKLFINLIFNSINYGKKGGATSIIAKSSGKNIIITISDNGIGISKKDLPHVFERFYKADKSHTSYKNSTGLGLAIVKWVVDIHKGTIDLSSVEGKGTIFKISLPMKD